jgi:hypothetical protein
MICCEQRRSNRDGGIFIMTVMTKLASSTRTYLLSLPTNTLRYHQRYNLSKQTKHFTMAPLNTQSSLFSTVLHKRDEDCTYYDASCSTHRLALMIIIICVGIIVSAILSLLYVRSRRSKAAKIRASMYQQRVKPNHEEFSTWQASSMRDSAPPPYEPRRPERVARIDGEWR